MTREEAIKVYRAFGLTKTEVSLRRALPQWVCDEALNAAAEDAVDAMMCLGVLKCEPPEVAKSFDDQERG